MADQRVQQILQRLRTGGSATARELGQALGASQPTLSRLLRAAGEQIVAIGQARARRYAASREVRGLGRAWVLYRIDRTGQPQRIGVLRAVHGGPFHFAANARVDWLRGEFADGLFPGLPWFMDDMRPQGFLGRAFAHRIGPLLGLPVDLARWNDDDVLTALLWRGTDVAGDLVLGETALAAALLPGPAPIARAARDAAYAHLAQAALAGDLVGSPAAGEQPKFTACIENAAGQPQQVLVKFSGPLTGQAVGRRWADLLWAEHISNQVLAEAGIATAATEVLYVADRCMLQSVRFDRVGVAGRTGFTTLGALDDAYFGKRDTWALAAHRLARAGWITAADADRVALCWWFGCLIGNTDMHFGNLGFRLVDHRPLPLAPLYDMAPMHYRPAADGTTERRPYVPPAALPEDRAVWQRARALAQIFWQRIGDTTEISPEFRAIGAAQHEAVDALRKHYG